MSPTSLPSQEDAWRTLAERVGGQYFRHGGSTAKVTARVGEWDLTLDTLFIYASGDHTRLRAPFASVDGFWFKAYENSILTALARLFGMQDIEVGDPQFDRRFVVQSNNEIKARAVLSERPLPNLFSKAGGVYVRLVNPKDRSKPVVAGQPAELYLQLAGVLRDIDRLETLFKLSEHLLHQVRRGGSGIPLHDA